MVRRTWVVAATAVLAIATPGCRPDYVNDSANLVGNGSVPGIAAAFGFDPFQTGADPGRLPTITSIELDGADEGLEADFFLVHLDVGLGQGAGGRQEMVCGLRHELFEEPVDLAEFTDELDRVAIVAMVSSDQPGVYTADGLRVGLGRRSVVVGNAIRLVVDDPAERTETEVQSLLASDEPCTALNRRM